MPGTVSAQLHEQYWHFGSTAQGLFFDASASYALSITTNSYTPYGNEGSTVIVDPVTGDLRFYTDGMRIVDKNHQQMPNGGGLLGHASNFSNGKACPDPGNCDRYYVFSSDFALEDGTPSSFMYSVVDISLPGNGTMASPLGDVVPGLKNVILTGGGSESIELVPRPNSHEYWLLLGKEGLNTIEVYLISASGITFNSTYAIPITMESMVSMDYCAENGKVALLSYQEIYPCLIADFNNVTGTLGGTVAIPGTPWGGSVLIWQGSFDTEWSPDGTKLYISKYRWGATAGGRLYQYDLNTPSIAPVMIHSVGASNNAVARGIKLAPDGKIYMIWKPASGPVNTLHVVNNPNQPGLACGFVANAVNMGVDIGNTHLFPDFPEYFNTIPVVPDSIIQVPCSQNTVSFTPLEGYGDTENDNLSWTVTDFYGGAYTVTGSSLDFTFSPGSTNGQLTFIYQDDYCFYLQDTFVVDLVVTVTGSLSLPDSIETCAGSTVQMDAGPEFISYDWSTGQITQQIDIISTGMYSLIASDGACDYFDTTYVEFHLPQAVSLGPDINQCADSLELSTGTYNGIITWSDGFMGEDNMLFTSGEYSVIAEDVNGCFVYDTVNIVLNPLPVIDLGPDTSICSYDEFYLEAIGYASVLWNDGSTDDSLLADQGGNYSVVVTAVNGCTDISDIDVIVNVPVQVSVGPDITSCTPDYLLSTFGFAGTVNWSTGNSGLNNLVSNSGSYSVVAEDNNGCVSYDTVNVLLVPAPFIDLGPDTTICAGDFSLQATGFTSVLWSDGSSGPVLAVLESGTYSVEVTNSVGCVAGDLIHIDVIDPQAPDLGTDVETCNASEVILSAGVDLGTFSWSTGETTSTITVDESGSYILTHAVCGNTWTDSIRVTLSSLNQVTYVPNAFTPDGDELNNEFAVVFGDYSHVLDYRLLIYDRWGELVFSTTDPFEKWDGTNNVGLVQTGVYIYVLSVETDCFDNPTWEKRGHVTVLK